jgi:hypothetical protein
LGGEVFLSNAVISDKSCLRAYIVNFKKNILEMVEIIGQEGRQLHQRLNNPLKE